MGLGGVQIVDGTITVAEGYLLTVTGTGPTAGMGVYKIKSGVESYQLGWKNLFNGMFGDGTGPLGVPWQLKPIPLPEYLAGFGTLQQRLGGLVVGLSELERRYSELEKSGEADSQALISELAALHTEIEQKREEICSLEAEIANLVSGSGP